MKAQPLASVMSLGSCHLHTTHSSQRGTRYSRRPYGVSGEVCSSRAVSKQRSDVILDLWENGAWDRLKSCYQSWPTAVFFFQTQ